MKQHHLEREPRREARRLTFVQLSYAASHERRGIGVTSQRPQTALSVYNLQGMLAPQRQFNGYLFNVVLYPSGHFELLFQMPMRAEESSLQVRRVHRDSEVCEGQYWGETASEWCAVNVRCSASPA